MARPIDKSPTPKGKVAYIRLMDPEVLPDEIRERTEGMERIYSVHGADGKVLALVDDRSKAFIVARMNELKPVSVH